VTARRGSGQQDDLAPVAPGLEVGVRPGRLGQVEQAFAGIVVSAWLTSLDPPDDTGE
jgi:hypothetical protein